MIYNFLVIFLLFQINFPYLPIKGMKVSTNMIKTILIEFKVNSPEKDSFIQGILDGLKKRDFVFQLLSSMLYEDCHFNRSIYENSNSVLNVSWIKDSYISMTSRYVSGNYGNTGCGVFEWGILD